MKAKGSSSTQDGPALTVIYYILPSLLKKQRSDVQQTARATKGWKPYGGINAGRWDETESPRNASRAQKKD